MVDVVTVNNRCNFREPLEAMHRDRKKIFVDALKWDCLLYTSPSPRDGLLSRMPSSA